jgi:cation transport ATPase
MTAGEPGELQRDLPEAQQPNSEAEAEEPIQTWWQRSAPKAAGAALALGAGTLWFGNMLSRVPLDEQSTFSYLLMLPLLLIVPAFSLAALKLSWTAFSNRTTDARTLVLVVALTAAAFNLLAMGRFGSALWRIFTN